ncbi:hypothetical protein [Actinoplanes sp. NPDC026619]|uniref:hypothetical protein n=1 Tax=Actinoplanes sp. NPDC026619 TaxID=3155798 RepID=UPI0033FBCB3C
MDFQWNPVDQPTEPSATAAWSGRGLLHAASPTVLFVQLWQDWRAESGTGLAYFAEPPTTPTPITTASGDLGHPKREVGDGWWWVA